MQINFSMEQRHRIRFIFMPWPNRWEMAMIERKQSAEIKWSATQRKVPSARTTRQLLRSKESGDTWGCYFRTMPQSTFYKQNELISHCCPSEDPHPFDEVVNQALLSAATNYRNAVNFVYTTQFTPCRWSVLVAPAFVVGLDIDTLTQCSSDLEKLDKIMIKRFPHGLPTQSKGRQRIAAEQSSLRWWIFSRGCTPPEID